MIRRICLYGGPGAGKSVLSHDLAGAFGKRGHRVEHVPEAIKPWAYAKRFPKGFQQLKIFSKQLDREEEFLLYDVDFIVTDSPLLMNASYSKKYGFVGWEHIVNLAVQFEKEYPAINIFLPRRFDYKAEGRYQSPEEALEIDEMIKGMMQEHLPPESLRFDTYEFDSIVEMVEEELRA